jgi:hypothetical protein
MIPTSNTHKTSDQRLNVRPNMSDMTSFDNSYNVALTRERYSQRYAPALSSKTLIYDQARIGPPPTRYGTRFIRYVDPTVRYSPAGMDMRNSMKATGLAFTKPTPVNYPQNVSFI